MKIDEIFFIEREFSRLFVCVRNIRVRIVTIKQKQNVNIEFEI